MAKEKAIGRSKTYRFAIAGMCTALICVLALITVPTGAVPFTLSLFAVFLVGAILSPKYALAASVCYILIGIVGLPVFSNFSGGLGIVFGPTGGYIISYLIMAFITSLSKCGFKKKSILTLMLGMLPALAICYGLGTLWFTAVTGTGFVAALSLCVVPFIWFDLLKIILAAAAAMLLDRTPVKKYLI